MNKNTLIKEFEKYSNLANINKNITPKSFRHSFATLKYENNINYSTIAEMLGHNNISTTGIYVHTKCQDLKQAFMKEII